MENSKIFIRRKGLYIIVFCTFCMWMNLTALYPVIPLIMRDLQSSEIQIEGMLGFTFILVFVVSMVSGRISDKYGRKTHIIFGMILLMISSILISMAHSILIFYTALLLGGLGHGLFLAPAFSSVADVYFSEKRGAAFGFLGSAIGIGSAMGYVLGGLIGRSKGWHILFVIFCFVNLSGFLSSIYLNETNYNIKEKKNQKAIFKVKDIITNSRIRELNPLAVMGIIIIMITPFVLQEVSITLVLISLLFIPYEVIGIVGKVAILGMSNKLSRVIVIAFLLAILTIVIYWLVGFNQKYLENLIPFAYRYLRDI